MDWRQYVRSHLPPLAVSPERETEIVEELAVQLETTYERERERGVSDAEARLRAEAEVPDWMALARTLGSIERPYIQRPAPGVEASGRLDGLLTDLAQAARSMTIWRGVASAVAMLALAMCAATTVFVAARSWSLPVPARVIGHEVALIWGTNHTIGQARDVVSGPTFMDWQRRNQSFAAMAAFQQTEMTIRAEAVTDVIGALAVTPGFFDVLQIAPAAGRLFVEDDAFAPPTAMISFAAWRDRFGGDPGIIGRTLAAFGQPHVVVGVLPEDFRFFSAPDVVTLLNPRDLEREQRSAYIYWVIGRLRPGHTFNGAQRDLAIVMSLLEAQYPIGRGWQATVEPLRAVMREPLQWPLAILMVTAGLVFAIGVANSLSLVAAHRVRRAREFAIRAALGATAARLRRLSILESGLVAGSSAVLALALTYGAVQAIQTFVPRTAAIAGSAATIELPDLTVDDAGFGFVIVSALLIVAVLSLPVRLPSGASSLAVTANRSRRLSAARQWLLAGQMAVSTLLLGVAGGLLLMIAGILRTAPGFTADSVLTMIIGRVEDLDAAARARYYSDVLRRVHNVPGVIDAALNDYVPLTNEDDYEGVEIPGRPRDAAGQLPREEWRRISHGYFATMGIAMTRGRTFVAADDERAASVVIVNEAMAQKYWGDRDPVGSRIRITSRPYGWSEVIGVVANIREGGLDKPEKPMMFVPFQRASRPVMGLFVKAAGSAESVAAAVAEAVRAADSTRPVFQARTMSGIVRESYAVQWSTLLVAGALALIALGMTLGGTYAIVSLVTAARTPEIGVRIALGASRADVLATVMSEPLKAAGIGIAVGLVATWFAGQEMRAHVSGVPAFDWPSALIVAAIVATVVVIACVGPGRSATRVDPVTALRSE